MGCLLVLFVPEFKVDLRSDWCIPIPIHPRQRPSWTISPPSLMLSLVSISVNPLLVPSIFPHQLNTSCFAYLWFPTAYWRIPPRSASISPDLICSVFKSFANLRQAFATLLPGWGKHNVPLYRSSLRAIISAFTSDTELFWHFKSS